MQKSSSSKQQPKLEEEERPSWQVDPKVYHRLFQGTPDGAAILQELSILFYDRSSVVAGDPYATHEKEGERNVVRFIIEKCAAAQQ